MESVLRQSSAKLMLEKDSHMEWKMEAEIWAGLALFLTWMVIVRPEMEKKQLSLRRLAHGIVTDRSLMYPSTNSTGRSAESIRELMVLKHS